MTFLLHNNKGDPDGDHSETDHHWQVIALSCQSPLSLLATALVALLQ